jgi:CubicO group peptidase (beta-lactamase class C family)
VTAAPIEDSTARHLSQLLATEQRKSRLPSVAAGIVRDGALAWSDAIGTLDGRAGGVAADTDTQYRMGSITKTFVAVAVMRLRDAGRLDLLDRFDDHVPGTAFGDVTIAQLLSHGGGLQAETEGPWWERTAGVSWDELAASPVRQRFRAGRRFHYTNVGFAALGELVARAHGTDWFEVIRRDLLAPLGMTRTTTRPTGKAAQGLAVHPFADVLLPEPEHDAGAMAPAGQLWTTVEDLLHWAAFAGGDTAEVLSPDTLAEMYEPHTINDNPGQPWTGAHGLGWQVWNVEGTRYAGHGGSMPGFLAGLRVEIESGDGVVILTNTTSGMGAIGPERLTAYLEREPRTPEPWHAAGDPGLLELVGRGTGVRRSRRPRSSASTSCSASRARRAAPASSGWAPTSGSVSTATTRVSRCGWSGVLTAAPRTSTSHRSASPAPPTPPTPTCRAGSTTPAGAEPDRTG